MTDINNNPKQEPDRLYMYHCFPRRRAADDDGAKGLLILELIAQYGILLTPEIVKWKDKKMAPGPSEEYTQVSRRCCFTELSRNELEKHAEFFGQYILEFDCRTLCDLGAMPVFYIPRMSEYEDYGIGPALITQLAHVQDFLSRITEIDKFAQTAVSVDPSLPIIGKFNSGNFVLHLNGTNLTCTIPSSIIDRAKKSNPSFILPKLPPDGLPIGVNSGGLSSIFNFLSWGLHKTDVLVGTIKVLASLFYPSERIQDPLLSYYQQREWRLIGGLLREMIPVTEPPSKELNYRLLELDPDFFGRQIDLPTGRKSLIDECEVFSKNQNEEPVISLCRRVICPNNKVADVQAILRNFENIQVISHDEHFGL